MRIIQRGRREIEPPEEPALLTAEGLPVMGSFADDYAPRVSVIIPSYNYGWCVADAVRSVQAQTLADWELLIVEDGSADNSREVVDALAAEDPRIHVWHQLNQGLSVTRNAGLWRARGDYVALLDCDDYYLPGKLAEQVAYLDNHPEVGMVYADALLEDGSVWQNHRHEAFTYERLLECNLVPCQSVMFRRELVQLVGGCDTETIVEAEDWDLWIRLCSVTRTVRLPQPNYVMRRHDRQKSMPKEAAAKARMLQDWALIQERGHELQRRRQTRGPIRILQAIQSLDGHGAQRVLLNILREVDREEFEVSVWANATGSMAEEIRALGFPVYYAGSNATNERLLHQLAAQADVVHLHYWGNDFHLPDTLANAQKLVVTNHCLGNQYRRAGHVVTCWRPDVPMCPPARYNPADVCLHNGLDFPALDAARLDAEEARRLFGLPESGPCFVTLSRAGAVKGWDHFCETAERIFEQHPDAHFLMVGPEACDQFYRALKEREEQFRAAGRDFRVLGNVPYAVAIAALCAADVVLLTSRSEAFPLTLLEALYLGKPVVASAVGGIPQIVGPHGACVRIGDVEGYAREALARVGQTVQAPEVRARYGADRMARRYEELYRWARMQSVSDPGRQAKVPEAEPPHLGSYWRHRGQRYNPHLHGAWNMAGPIGTETGFGKLNAALARGLLGTGLPLGLVNRDAKAALLPDDLRSHESAYANARWALVSSWNDDNTAFRCAQGLPLKVSMTEGTALPDHLVAHANLSYRVLCPNVWNKVVHKLCGVQPPITVFRATLPNAACLEHEEHEGWRVLSVGDMWERKDPEGMVQAFQQAFPEQKYPLHTLTLKSVRHWRGENPCDRRVRVQLGHVGQDALLEYYRTADCYLQMAQAEGIGLPVLEAMAAGLPVVYPAHTGMLEFSSRSIGYPLTWLAHEPAPSTSLCRGRWHYGDWFRSDPREAALLLRQVAEATPEERADKSVAAQRYVAEHYNPATSAESLLAAAARYSPAAHAEHGPPPLVSVVVLWRDDPGPLAWTMQSLQPYVEGRAYEVLEAQGATLAEALQVGADKSAGEFVLFVQAGIAFETDLPAQLVGTFDYDIAVTAPKRLLPAPQPAGGLVLLRSDGTTWQHEPRRLVCNSDAATGCYMVRRDVLRHLCADSTLGGHAEVDLCLQARARGLRVVCNSEAVSGGAGVFEDPPSRSAALLREKWKHRPEFFSGWRPDAVLHEPRFSFVRAFERLSIVILCHNHLEVTQRCVQSLRDTTLRTPYELVVLDNASTDGTWEWLQQQEDVRAIRSEENLGVGGGRNAAAKVATGDLLLFLDNDMEMFPGWELPMLLPFSRADVDIAGPVAWEMDPEPPEGRDFRPLDGDLYPFADAVSGNCLFVRRACWQAQGGFDPTLHRFHEDGEWVVRARAEGYTVVGTPGDWCEHHAHTSTGAIVQQLHARKWDDYRGLCEAVADRLAPGALRRWPR